MSKRNWFTIEAKGPTPQVLIYDEIGMWGITAKDFNDALSKLGDLKGKDLHVRISSPGGDVFAGNAIYNMLRETGAKITVYVDAIAASMASVIAMAGDPVIMSENAIFMIHNPSAGVRGTSKEMNRIANLLDSLKAGMLAAYEAKTGMDREQLSAMMDAETWMDAKEAVAHGFADSIGPAVEAAATFDLSRFKSPPAASVKAAPAAQLKESTMDKTEIVAAVTEANKPLADAIGALVTALTPAAKEGADPKEAPANAETPEQVAARVNKERDEYESEVEALCALAGTPEAARDYIKAKKSVADVRAELAANAGKRKSTPAANGYTPPNGMQSGANEDRSDLVTTAIDYNKVWGSYNSAGKQGQRHAH